MKTYASYFVLLACLTVPGPATGAVGTWTQMTNAPGGGFSVFSVMLLLTDGTVVGAIYNGGTDYTRNWYRLTPNLNGSYLQGSWTNITPMHDTRLYFSSQVLRDGRLFVAGGEYGTGGNTAEVYNPISNTWSNTPFAGVGFADSASMLLPDGRVLVSPVGYSPYGRGVTFIYEPGVNNWSVGPTNAAYQDEASWVKLPDDSILTIDPNFFGNFEESGTNSERYIPALNDWIQDASVPVMLWSSNQEIGPALLLPNGKAFFFGATSRTAIYTPSGSTAHGSWVAGPDIPGGGQAADIPGSLMVDGRLLCCVSQLSGTNQFYEYDYLSNSFIKASNPVPNPTPYAMMQLPDGNILYEDYYGGPFVYRPSGAPLTAAKPTINTISANADGSFHLTGTLFNGISAGAAFGDDAQMDSNYPLVRMTNTANGNVLYARTFDRSSTSVQTGSRILTTECAVLVSVFQNGGTYSLVVVANGIASDPITLPQPVWVDFNYLGGTQNGTYNFPFKRLTNGISAVAANGTIFIKSAGHSAETNRITKTVRIIAYNGTAVIGR